LSNLGGSTQLQGADLRGADLTGAVLNGAEYDERTQFPEGFRPDASGMILVQSGL
jgi:uncharacterized protein YjbI with pentapeptide repeats